MTFPADLTPGGPDDLYLCCDELLEACEDAVATTRGGPIKRAFVSASNPAFDCVEGGQLTVHAGGPLMGDTLPLQPPLQPAHRVDLGMQVNLVALTVTVIRCAAVPQGQSQGLPPALSLAHVAAIVNADCWAIWNTLATQKRNGGLFGPKEREMFFDPAYAVQASGGTVGWQLAFRVQLNGYRGAAT